MRGTPFCAPGLFPGCESAYNGPRDTIFGGYFTMNDSAFTQPDWVGRKAERTVSITPELMAAFIALSGDSNPLHVSDGHALARGFRGRVVHGLLLGALVSGLIGMELPGRPGVLQSVQLSFHNPCYVGDTIQIVAEVTEFFESVQVAILQVVVRNSAGLSIATGKVQSGIRPSDG